jgi:hypothetical protein
MEAIPVSKECLENLPPGARILRQSVANDMERRQHECVEVVWFERVGWGGYTRKALFDRHTGEYITEC